MQAKDIATTIIGGTGVLVATIILSKAFLEYRLQGIGKRAEIFLQLRSRLRQDPSFARICDLLETDSEKLRKIPLVERDRLVGFFEELALLRNSGFLGDHVTLYMFGHFAIRCHESENFWFDLNRTQPLWSAFDDFAREMKGAQKDFVYDARRFRL